MSDGRLNIYEVGGVTFVSSFLYLWYTCFHLVELLWHEKLKKRIVVSVCWFIIIYLFICFVTLFFRSIFNGTPKGSWDNRKNLESTIWEVATQGRKSSCPVLEKDATPTPNVKMPICFFFVMPFVFQACEV